MTLVHAQPQHQDLAHSPPLGGGPTVLVADDDSDIRELVAFKLGQAGFVVVTAEDGPQALAVAREHTPSLALLDVTMPGMTGMDVTRALKADAATAEVPVILLTARAGEADIAGGLACGARDYVVKPFSPRDLVDRVRAVLEPATP